VDKGALIVTGSGRGIGAATARLAAARGYAVCVNFASNRAAADALVGDIIDAGGEAFAQRADVARREEVAALFEAVDQRYGGLAGLVNNAGVAGRVSPLAEADPVTIDRVIDVNVKGTIWCSQEAVRRMSTALGGKGGAIVNISSGSATIGSPGQYVWYAASKGAVDSLTMGLAKELAGEGIRVNAVAPGVVATDIHDDSGGPGRLAEMVAGLPMGRAAQPEEIAGAVLWLLSDEASYTTGTILRVAGGR
jgi:NAD(P)-dependent dehydrogenase (short-subunit alcohol dehydrogenase family)